MPDDPTEAETTDERPPPEDVELAEDIDAVVRDPRHDDTTQREAVENALQDAGVSEAGEELGDPPT
jgi:hypothetical protein